MLYILTGDIQTGKTRWLTGVLDELSASGVNAAGVIAPGVWCDHGPDASLRFEKLGIDNLLLPEDEVVPFARRADLAQEDGTFDGDSQAARAKLFWAIDDEAIERVNAHFDKISVRAAQSGGERPSLLVIDELGRLELLRGEGLSAAMQLLDDGASAAFPHALAIVRTDLLEVARERFADANWGGIQAIHADDQGKRTLFEAFGLSM